MPSPELTNLPAPNDHLAVLDLPGSRKQLRHSSVVLGDIGVLTTDPISTEQRNRLIAGIRADFTRAGWEIRNAGYDFVIGSSGRAPSPKRFSAMLAFAMLARLIMSRPAYASCVAGVCQDLS